MTLVAGNLEVARTEVNARAISGGLFLNGNNLSDPTQQNYATNLLCNDSINAIVRKGKAFRPVYGDTGTSPSTAFVLSDNGTNYIAVFNYTTSSKNVSVNLTRAGL